MQKGSGSIPLPFWGLEGIVSKHYYIFPQRVFFEPVVAVIDGVMFVAHVIESTNGTSHKVC